VADLDAAEEIFLTNSLRGIVSVRTWEGKPVRSSESATRLRAAYDAAVAAQVRG
jgi:branched-subunit amino acid aminotransferase/4-amino-4-deoxychorismate lyase